MNNKIIEWKWSNGEYTQKSKRQYRNGNGNSKQEYYDEMLNMDVIKENTAYIQSLNSENYWSGPQENYDTGFNNNQPDISGFKITNKREDSSFKMAEREMFATCGMNPFLGTNNYVNDVVTQNTFLKPTYTSEKEFISKVNEQYN